jgi:hypothetical protein
MVTQLKAANELAIINNESVHFACNVRRSLASTMHLMVLHSQREGLSQHAHIMDWDSHLYAMFLQLSKQEWDDTQPNKRKTPVQPASPTLAQLRQECITVREQLKLADVDVCEVMRRMVDNKLEHLVPKNVSCRFGKGDTTDHWKRVLARYTDHIHAEIDACQLRHSNDELLQLLSTSRKWQISEIVAKLITRSAWLIQVHEKDVSIVDSHGAEIVDESFELQMQYFEVPKNKDGLMRRKQAVGKRITTFKEELVYNVCGIEDSSKGRMNQLTQLYLAMFKVPSEHKQNKKRRKIESNDVVALLK